jgi:hypothetical protein
VWVEADEDPFFRKDRDVGELVEEVAKGRRTAKVLRA